MAYLDYYKQEDERYAEIPDRPITGAELQIAFQKLCRHFKLPHIRLEVTSGNRHSHFSPGEVRINLDAKRGWLVLAHEMGHFLHYEKRRQQITKLRDQMPFSGPQRALREARIEKIGKQRWHGRHHARFTDKVFAYIQKQGWNEGALAEKLAGKRQAAVERESQLRAARGSIDHKIERRRQQVQRLERKIKALTTRLKTARRSLSALERVKAKKTTSQEASCET